MVDVQEVIFHHQKLNTLDQSLLDLQRVQIIVDKIIRVKHPQENLNEISFTSEASKLRSLQAFAETLGFVAKKVAAEISREKMAIFHTAMKQIPPLGCQQVFLIRNRVRQEFDKFQLTFSYLKKLYNNEQNDILKKVDKTLNIIKKIVNSTVPKQHK